MNKPRFKTKTRHLMDTVAPPKVKFTPRPVQSDFWTMLGWAPEDEALFKAEQEMLRHLTTRYEQGYIKVAGEYINTLVMGTGPPLLLMHGFGSGSFFSPFCQLKGSRIVPMD